MRSSPSRFRIEAFLVPLDAFPTQVMLLAVRIDIFDDVIRFAIARLTAMHPVI